MVLLPATAILGLAVLFLSPSLAFATQSSGDGAANLANLPHHFRAARGSAHFDAARAVRIGPEGLFGKDATRDSVSSGSAALGARGLWLDEGISVGRTLLRAVKDRMAYTGRNAGGHGKRRRYLKRNSGSSSANPCSGQTPSKSSTTATSSSTAASTTTEAPSSTTKAAATPATPTPMPTGPSWKAIKTYEGSNFFDGWDFWDTPDPTHGQVNYLDQASAEGAGLAYVDSNGRAVMAVDDYTWLPPGANRNSVRISSKRAYKHDLVILDLHAMPYGCATWPAFWSNGPNWPNGGEIDIIEGVHNNVQNQMTLHTLPGCAVTPDTKSNYMGKNLVRDCNAYANNNAGCSILDPSTASYGQPLNAQGGGVFATLIAADKVEIWFFGRNGIPSDITSGNPNPTTWGTPQASFSDLGCNMNQYLGNQTLIFDTTLGGDWAGNTFSAAGCPGTLTSYLQDPSNFVNAKWIINSLKVYHWKT